MSIFDSSEFKPMDRVAGRASISVTKTGVGFSKQAIAKLNYSHYVQIFINQKDKLIGIRPCEESSPNAIKFVNQSKARVDSVRWNNVEFTNEINSLVSQDLIEQGYKVEADFLQEENALLFDFNKAFPLEKQ